MKDGELRRKLFGNASTDCLNLYEESYYSNKTRGFVGQTVNEVKALRRALACLKSDNYQLVDIVQNLQVKVDELTKKAAKKTSRKRK